jgi:hypothetical protein
MCELCSTCRTINVNLNLLIFPLADGSQLPEHVVQTGGVLHFALVTRDDAGNYTCLASNSLQGQITAAVQLTVAGIPSLTLVALMPTTPMQVTDTPHPATYTTRHHTDQGSNGCRPLLFNQRLISTCEKCIYMLQPTCDSN